MTPADLRAIRSAMQLTQAAFAARLGLTRDAIARMESGVLVIRPVIAMAIEHLGCGKRRRKSA